MKNPERLIIGLAVILLVSFTPMVPWLITSLGITDAPWSTFAIRMMTGILSLAAAIYAISGLREEGAKKQKEGKVQINHFLLLAGIIIIAVGWLTDISSWLVTSLGLEWSFEWGTSAYTNTSIPARLITAVFTFVGAVLIKKSFTRRKEVIAVNQTPDAHILYERTRDGY